MSKKAEGFSLRFVLINTGNISRKVLSKVLRSFDKNFERLHHEYVAAKDEYGKAELDMVLETELDEEEKTRFSRYFVAGYKISEMAKLENISENNMSVRLSRLRGKIAKCLYDGKIFDKKQKKSVRNDKKETKTYRGGQSFGSNAG